jgi:sugar/nucleoside kinase (ribokinase family)
MTPARRDIDLLVVGELNPDVIVLDADPTPVFGQVEKLVSSIRLEIGSSSAIMACGAARLGLAVAFVGVVGDDAMGRFMLDSLAARGVDMTWCAVDRACATGATVILSRGADRAILTATGTIDRLRADHVPADLLGRVRHVHLGSTALIGPLRAGLPGLLEAAHAAGATTSFDPNWDPAERWEGTDQLLAAADVALPNLTEAQRISGERDPLDAAQDLARRASLGRPEGVPPPIIAVKLGSEGALAVQGGQVARRDAPRTDVVDTTGAGDSFDAGFVAALIRGRPLEEALGLAVVCGSLSTRGIGGTAAQPTLDEAIAALGGAA